MTSESDWKALAREVTHARLNNGYRTAKSLAKAMGVTPRLIGEIENARRTSYGRSTLALLEHALSWPPGAVNNILAGLPPRGESRDTVARRTYEALAESVTGPDGHVTIPEGIAEQVELQTALGMRLSQVAYDWLAAQEALAGASAALQAARDAVEAIERRHSIVQADYDAVTAALRGETQSATTSRTT